MVARAFTRGSGDRDCMECDYLAIPQLGCCFFLGSVVRAEDETRFVRLGRALLCDALELVSHRTRDVGWEREDDARIRWQVARERRELFVVRWQEALGAEEGTTGRDIVDEDAGLRRRPVDHVG